VVAVGKSNGGKQRQREVDVWAKVRTHVGRQHFPDCGEGRNVAWRAVGSGISKQSRGTSALGGWCAGKVGEVGARCRRRPTRHEKEERKERHGSGGRRKAHLVRIGHEVLERVRFSLVDGRH